MFSNRYVCVGGGGGGVAKNETQKQYTKCSERDDTTILNSVEPSDQITSAISTLAIAPAGWRETYHTTARYTH